ncbi:MAG: hypothetical protein D6705_17860 [Deltaproteobacteria bacterium]|nr:MAG: hypothetical protein D6705_17860 [Deltaproteobacteria bacterium]
MHAFPMPLRTPTLAALCLAGCTFIARGPDQYRDDTRALLETKTGSIQACYDEALKQDPNLSGTVTVHFKVEKKTGIIRDVEVDPDRSTAPSSLANCVAKAIDGLQLTPEDQRDGVATFTWKFSPKSG